MEERDRRVVGLKVRLRGGMGFATLECSLSATILQPLQSPQLSVLSLSPSPFLVVLCTSTVRVSCQFQLIDPGHGTPLAGGTPMQGVNVRYSAIRIGTVGYSSIDHHF